MTQITKTEATIAARRFLALAGNIGDWTMSHAENCLPAGYILSPSVDDGDFFPMTVANVAKVYAHGARLED